MKIQGLFDYTQRDFWGGPWYSYWMLMIATILFGLFGGDHLFLRSPQTAILKLIINFVGLGIWWLYDMIQIIGEKDLVMKHGLSAPIIGPLGIGAGMFTDNQPNAKKSKSPWRYLIYMFLVFLPWGLDSLIAGDGNGAVAKFISGTHLLLLPILAIWMLMSMGRAWLTPKSLFEGGPDRMFPFSWFMDKRGPCILGPVDIPDKPPDECDSGSSGLGGLISNMFKKFFNMIFFFVPPIVQTFLNTVLPGVVPAVAATSKAVELGAKTTSEVIGAIHNPAVATAATGSALVQSIPSAVAAVPQIASQVGSQLNTFTDPKKLQEIATIIPPPGGLPAMPPGGMMPPMPPQMPYPVPQMPQGMVPPAMVPPAMPTIPSLPTPMPQVPQLGTMVGGGIVGSGMVGRALTSPDSNLSSVALFCLFSGILLGGSIYAIKRLNKSFENFSSGNGNDGRKRNDTPPKPSRF